MKKILGFLPLLLLIVVVGCDDPKEKYEGERANDPLAVHETVEELHMDKEAKVVVEEVTPITPTTVDSLDDYVDAEELLSEVDALLADIDTI